jgi:hypothetical protein
MVSIPGQRSFFASGQSLPTPPFSLPFGTSAKFWVGLQADYDLDVAQDHLGHRLGKLAVFSFLAPLNNSIELTGQPDV